MGEPLEITIFGNPGDGGTNAAYRAVRRKVRGSTRVVMTKTDRGKLFKARALAAATTARLRQVSAASDVRVAGSVRVAMRVYWPQQRHLEGASGLAHGDVDAPIKATLDALESSGIIDDDSRVVELCVSKAVDRDRPRIEVEVFPVDTQGGSL